MVSQYHFTSCNLGVGDTAGNTVLATLNVHNMGSDEAYNFVFKGK